MKPESGHRGMCRLSPVRLVGSAKFVIPEPFGCRRGGNDQIPSQEPNQS